MCQCFLADSGIPWGRWFGPRFVDHWENEDQLWDFKGFYKKPVLTLRVCRGMGALA